MIKSKEQLVSILESGEWETLQEFKSFLKTKEIKTALDDLEIGTAYDSDRFVDSDEETESFFESQIYLKEDGPNYVLLYDREKSEAILNQIISVEICDQEICDDFVSLEMFDNAATSRKFVLNGFQVTLYVSVKLKSGDELTYAVILQSIDRSNGMRAYGSYEMSFGGAYGATDDESRELSDFLAKENGEVFSDEFMESLIDSAEKIAKEYVEGISILDRIIMLIKSENEYLIHNGYGEVTCIADEPDNGKTLDILREFNLDDDTDVLEEVFGSDGLKAIRDAEQGIY